MLLDSNNEMEVFSSDVHVVKNDYMWLDKDDEPFNSFTTVTLFNDPEETSLNTVWNVNCTRSEILTCTNIEDTISTLYEISCNLTDDFCKNNLVEKISQTYREYLNDQSSAKLKTFPNASVESLKQVVRFIPELNRFFCDVYLDEVSGEFGISLRASPSSRTVLNLLMQENQEVIFSYVTKGKGMVKISGRAYFNNQLEDSSYIRKLLRMIR